MADWVSVECNLPRREIFQSRAITGNLMLNENAVLLTMEHPCDEAIEWLAGRIRQAGFMVVQSFNLQETRQPQRAFPCPQHGRRECDCQVVVLLIYGRQNEPLTLIAYGYGQQTWFSVVNTLQQRADLQVEAAILTLASTGWQ